MTGFIIAGAHPCRADVNEQAVVSGFQYYFDPDQRDGRTAGRTVARPGLSPTMAALDVLRHWDDLSPEARATLSRNIKISPRRNGAREISTEYTGICTESVTEDTHPHVDTAHFRVIYKTGAGGSTASFAQQIANAAEVVWNKEITLMGYPVPRLKPDNKMRIYLCDILGPFGAFGFMWPEYEYSDHTARAHIELDNDFEGFTLPNGMSSEDFIDTTVAHEFFHAIQVGMNFQAPSSWLVEATANWIEEEVFPDNFDYFYYVEEKFNNMNVSLDYWSYEDVIGYGSGIFFRYLTERVLNPDFIKTIFTELKAECTDLGAHTWCNEDVTELLLIDSLLKARGLTFENVYHDFATSSVKCEYRDCADSRFPRVQTKAFGVSYSDDASYSETLPHLSSRVLLTSNTCANSLPSGISLKLSATYSDPKFSMTLLKEMKTGGWDAKSVVMVDGEDATISDMTYCADYDRFYVIISNTEFSYDNYYRVDLTITTKDYVSFSHSFPEGWNLVGMPFIPAYEEPERALDIDGLLQLRLGKYIDTGLDPATAGMVYWSYFNSQTYVSTIGEASTADTVALSTGWNMISVPRNANANWNSGVLVLTGTGSMNINAADAALYVKPFLYSFDPATEQFSDPIGITDGHVMNPWKGYAVYALQPCSLKFVF